MVFRTLTSRTNKWLLTVALCMVTFTNVHCMFKDPIAQLVRTQTLELLIAQLNESNPLKSKLMEELAGLTKALQDLN